MFQEKELTLTINPPRDIGNRRNQLAAGIISDIITEMTVFFLFEYMLYQFPNLNPGKNSAELPPFATLVAETECGHRLIGAPCLNLIIGAVSLFTLGTLDQVSRGSTCHGHLMLSNHFLSYFLPHLFHVRRCHFLPYSADLISTKHHKIHTINSHLIPFVPFGQV